MNELLNLVGKIDSSTVSTLSAVDDIASKLEIPYLVIGATARDFVLHYGYGAPIQRATTDIDLAVQVETWDDFNSIKEALVNKGFTTTRAEHRLTSPHDFPIDIVPFGNIEQENANIAWPPSGEVVMNVAGFKEAIDNAQSVLISENPVVTCPVVTPEGLMILKLICWADRASELRKKDAADIRYLLKTYIEIKNIKQDIYDDENIAELENYGWDQELAACHLLGQNCREIASAATYSEILKLNDSGISKNIERIAIEMAEGTSDENLKILDAFMNGFT